MAHEDAALDDPWKARLRADFDVLAARYRPQLSRVVGRIVGDPQRTEELVQDALMTAYRKLDSYEGRAAFSTWLCGIGKHLALNDVRKHGELLTEDGVLDADDEGITALSLLRRQEREELMRQAAHDLLTEQEQELVYLRYTENLGRAQIARIMGLEGENEVRVILQRCRRRLERGLRARLEQLGHGTSFIRTSW